MSCGADRSYSSDLTPGLGTSICHRCGSKQTKNLKKNLKREKLTWELSLTPREDKVRRWPSLRIKSTCTLIFEFLASRTVRNKFLLFKTPSIWDFVMGAPADKDTRFIREMNLYFNFNDLSSETITNNNFLEVSWQLPVFKIHYMQHKQNQCPQRRLPPSYHSVLFLF